MHESLEGSAILHATEYESLQGSEKCGGVEGKMQVVLAGGPYDFVFAQNSQDLCRIANCAVTGVRGGGQRI